MKKIGIKLFKDLDYEHFEPLQYWLNHDVEHEDVLELISKEEIIELELEDDEDRAEDIEMLQAFLKKFDNDGIVYELFVMNDEWKKSEFKDIL